MLKRHKEVGTEWISRRTVIKGLAGLALVMSDYACALAIPPSVPAPTATPRPLGSIIYTFNGHTDRVTSVAWSPDGRRIASGSLDKTVQVWDVVTGSQAYTHHDHSKGVTAVAWSPDGKHIASGSFDKTVQVWNAVTGNILYTYRGHTDTVSSLAWNPVWRTGYPSPGWDALPGGQVMTDSQLIASGSFDKTVQVWNATTGDVLYTYRGHNVDAAKLNPIKGVLPDLVFVVAWSHNGKRIAAVTQEYCGDECGVVVIWDAATGRNVSFYADLPIFALAWSPDDKRIVTALGYTLVKISQAS